MCVFSHLGCGQLLHNILTLVFQILTEYPTVRFMISSPVVCLKALLSVFLLPRCNDSFKTQVLMQLLHSGCTPRFFPNVHSFRVPLPTLSMARFSVVSQSLVLYDRLPYATPLLHGGSSLCRQWPTSSRAQHCPRSVSAAVGRTLRLDASPHTLLQCSDSFHCGLSFGDYLILHYKLRFFWICLQTSLRLFPPGLCPL
jgi:hypothetical protein